MAAHRNDDNINELKTYFTSVIDWITAVFDFNPEKDMCGLRWGELYERFHNTAYDPADVAAKVRELYESYYVKEKKGIYEYLLTGDEKHLSIRQFSDSQKREAYERQQGICPICKKHFDFDKMHADHITPWHAGGKTVPENLQMLCRDCNLKKSGQE